MTYVVTSACVGCKDTACVSVCPVDCFYEGPHTLVIDPDECIDCALCEPECPTGAIYSENDIPEEQRAWIQINADKCSVYENITDQKEAMAHESPYTIQEAIQLVLDEEL